jgi:hypothetical protein
MIIMFNTNIAQFNKKETYLMRLPEDGPKCGPKHVKGKKKGKFVPVLI